jgi:hypothetical protein
MRKPRHKTQYLQSQYQNTMKFPLIKTLLVGLSVAAASPLVAGTQDQTRLLIGDDAKIVVHYVESLQPISMGGIYPEGAETDRLNSFSRVLKEAFLEAGLPAEVDVVRNGSRAHGDLDITVAINQWDLNSMGEYECRFAATVSNGEEKVDLGVFVGRFNQLVIVRGSNSEYTYDVAARKAADKMVSHFIRG